MTLRVNIEDLVVSGVAVTGHGEDMAMRHYTADSRVQAAQRGWQGRSAAALTARSEKWTASTGALLARLSEHALDLHSSARCFSEMEERHRQELENL